MAASIEPADLMTAEAAGSAVPSWPVEQLEAVEACPLCGCADRTTLHRDLTDCVFFCAPGRWSFYRCADCGAAYLDPRPTAASIAQAYTSYYTHESEGDNNSPTHALARLKRSLYNGYLNAEFNLNLRPDIPWGWWVVAAAPSIRLRRNFTVRHLRLERLGARLLDIGCGNGAFLRTARDCGWEAEGLDPDPCAAAAGRAAGLPVSVGGLPATGYADGRFAAVTMSHSIEHLHDPAAGLREVHRILQPGGIVWIDTPNLDSRGHKTFRGDWRGLEPPRHLVLFTASALAATLSRAGFNQIRQVRGPFVSPLYFTCSHRILRRENAMYPKGSRLPPILWLKARLADWCAFAQPAWGEEIITIARRGP